MHILVPIVILVFLASMYPASARDLDGRWAQTATPQQRQWFKSQRVPGGPNAGTPCCDISDGVYAEEDIEGDHYVVTFEAFGQQYKRIPVPDEVVIKDANNWGRAVVWFWLRDSVPVIRCFAPGSGI